MNRLLLSLLAILAACSCQIKGLYETVPVVFTAVIEDGFSGGETRTSLDADGNVLWKRGDQVSIFAGSTVNEQYQVSDASDGKTSASLEKVSGTGFVAGVEIENNVAFYPYAARVLLGEPWRLPTDEEILELVDTTKCRWQWTSLQGVPGYRVTSLVNGNSIFLPASGRYYRTYGLQKTDTDGYYWSSDLNGTNTMQGYCLHFAEDAASIAHYGGERSSGHVLRAVTE